MAGKLEIYNLALVHLGEIELASLSEAREPRRVLDRHWNMQVRYCLERGAWQFAKRSVELPADISMEPVFGYKNAFAIPADRLAVEGMSTSDYFNPPLNRVHEEGGYWFADEDVLYAQYVSSDPAFGLDMGRWPSTFADYVGARLARICCKRISQSDSNLDTLIKVERQARLIALSADARQQPTKTPPQGSWVTARMGSYSRSYDRGGNG